MSGAENVSLSTKDEFSSENGHKSSQTDATGAVSTQQIEEQNMREGERLLQTNQLSTSDQNKEQPLEPATKEPLLLNKEQESEKSSDTEIENDSNSDCDNKEKEIQPDPGLTDEEEKNTDDEKDTNDVEKDTNDVEKDTNDVEMVSQSSGETDPIEGEEEKSDDEEVKTKSNNKKRSDDWSEGSGNDDNWSRPWRTSSDDYWRKPKKITLPRLSRYSSMDTEQYRKGYPRKKDDASINHNYEFYTNTRPSYPDGDFVDIIHEEWWGNYDRLEYHHSYIQWLFPIRERGLNWHAEELQLHEIEKIIANKDAHRRVLKSYKMMLDFYGLELKDEKTGEVKRSPNWSNRFNNLNYSGHNYLRITRILKCLGEFEYEHLKAPLIRHCLREAIIEKTLINALNSCVSYWIEVIKDDKEREELHKYAKTLVDKVNNKTK